MQPGKRSSIALSMSSRLIQLPRVPFTPGMVLGTVSRLLRVHMNVLLSTRATSAGFVRANQLQKQISSAKCLFLIYTA